MKIRKVSLIALLLFGLSACLKTNNANKLYKAPAMTEAGFNMVVEIPAGSSHKYEFNPATMVFEIDQIDGKDRIIDFLPYPGNYGFIPSTLMEEERGGDGDALDVLLISEAIEQGSLVEFLPIAALLLNDGGEIDTKIIGIPIDPDKQVIKVKNFQEFLIKYDAAKKIVEDWFLNYKGFGKTEFLGWKDDTYAREEIKKWMLQ